MNTSRVYEKDGFWMVDYIDSNYQLVPAVGIFRNEEDAKESAKLWNEELDHESV